MSNFSGPLSLLVLGQIIIIFSCSEPGIQLGLIRAAGTLRRFFLLLARVGMRRNELAYGLRPADSCNVQRRWFGLYHLRSVVERCESVNNAYRSLQSLRQCDVMWRWLRS